MAQTGRGSRGGGRSTGRKSSSSSRSSSTRTASARSAAARKGAATKSTTKRTAAARKAGQARGRQQRARKAAGRAGARASGPAAEVTGKSPAEVRDALTRGLIRPLNMVMLTRDRIEEVMDEAVKRGRLTADDAQDVVQGLIQRGRKQTNDVLRDLEQLLGVGAGGRGSTRQAVRKRGVEAAERARRQVEDATTRARKRAVKTADPVLAQADRARRAAGVGPTFPIMGYDELTAAQVQSRISGLTPAQLRKVRDYERRNANRKSVLSAVNAKLG
jgi:polyhydroxyalkanoate synthesis regulator phasin